MSTITANMAAAWLRQAADLIEGGRQEDYGDFFDNAQLVAEDTGVHALVAVDVMIGFKNARLHYSESHEDSIVDKIGYYALREAVRQRILRGD